MADTARHDVWAQGDAYERYVGRWSRPVAEQFLAWLGMVHLSLDLKLHVPFQHNYHLIRGVREVFPTLARRIGP